ncbi:putative transcriptional regulatory protein [Cercophora samala]|uniref:Chromatin modification-related protein n=1 Tax=Cercophora samala TaxID=330535 RepID=A0AA40DBZ8_9PEZI|nr:putative transcriptional regulatory protein [Cercophora samala]
MKTAKPSAPENGGSSRRAQPLRQTRMVNRGNASSSLIANAPAQPIDIFPGLNHFTDAISALPKEIVRHFTLLKEVDAKIFNNEGKLFDNIRRALDTPPPVDPFPSSNDAHSSLVPASAPMSAQNSSGGVPLYPSALSIPSANGPANPASEARRRVFKETNLKIQEMMVALEEKNHVLLTANDALEKQMKRIESVWPNLESEFSEEAKWGSANHWAYDDVRKAQQQAKSNDKAERSRREGAAALSAAAQHVNAEEAAARSNDRKQAVAAKKNAKGPAGEGDADKTNEPAKKTQGPKSRKAPAEAATPVGLGITTGAPAGPAPAKRRKVETAKANGGTPMERAMSSVFGNSTVKPKTTSPRETPVPESGPKKRKALPTSSGQAKKRTNNTATMSPSMASSPVIGAFPDTLKGSRASPIPATIVPPRPASSRARQNSAQLNPEAGRQRAASVASTKPNGNAPDTPNLSQFGEGLKATVEIKVPKETPIPAPTPKLEPLRTETEIPPPVLEPLHNGSSRKEMITKPPATITAAPATTTTTTTTIAAAATAATVTTTTTTTIAAPEERPEPKKEKEKDTVASPATQPTPIGTVKTKSGRASKPSTPSLGTFAEAASMVTTAPAERQTAVSRSRPSRNTSEAASATDKDKNNGSSTSTNTTTTSKRSHKKGASISAAAAALAQTSSSSHSAKGSSNGGSITSDDNIKGSRGTAQHQQPPQSTQEDDDDDEPDGDEPRYCKCNGVSYGEMVGCDGVGCTREWFHLECVGLKIAPKANAKWYCDECKERLKKR